MRATVPKMAVVDKAEFKVADVDEKQSELIENYIEESMDKPISISGGPDPEEPKDEKPDQKEGKTELDLNMAVNTDSVHGIGDHAR